jgi:hypothetical protein
MSTDEPKWSMYEVEECESGALHWVVASSIVEAAELVMEEDGFDRNELSVSQMPDAFAVPVTFEDGFDAPPGERLDVVGDGFAVSENEHGHPVVTGTAAQWAALYQRTAWLSCSEW